MRRLYSLVLIGGYAALAFFSIRFLLAMLLTKQSAPVEIVNIPKRLDADTYFAALTAPAENRPTVESTGRGPLAHFHPIPQWFQRDRGNSCTTAGCHTPLPHGKTPAVRAFLNMHGTFVDCVVCHGETPATAAGPRAAEWFTLPDRNSSGTPAILELAARLETLVEVKPEAAAAVSHELQGLLRRALPASGNNEQLANWLVRLETTNPHSRIWQRLIEEMRTGIQMHVHGEYGAKIGWHGDAITSAWHTPEVQAATKEYLEQGRKLAEPQRKAVLDRVHAGIKPVGALCTPCHSPTPTLVDLSRLGYPRSRVENLASSPIMRSILSIENGQPFYLPLEEGEETGRQRDEGTK